jgi:chlorite dismutase
MSDILFSFAGGTNGPWKVLRMDTLIGESIPTVSHLKISSQVIDEDQGKAWILEGVTSNLRYTELKEKQKLLAIQKGLWRSQASCAALIPIRKTEEWWALAQDERMAIFEKKSHHTKIGMNYLPAIARKLYHSQDIGEPFDFLTWFEYAPKHSDQFDELLFDLRKSEEWKYVDREIDIRVKKSET